MKQKEYIVFPEFFLQFSLLKDLELKNKIILSNTSLKNDVWF